MDVKVLISGTTDLHKEHYSNASFGLVCNQQEKSRMFQCFMCCALGTSLSFALTRAYIVRGEYYNVSADRMCASQHLANAILSEAK